MTADNGGTSRPHVVIGVELAPDQVDRIRAAFPDLTMDYAPGDEALRRSASGADVLFGGRKIVDLLPSAPRLKWVQAYSAGVNHLPLDELARRSILLTNASGAHGTQIAENILAMMLAFAVRLPSLIRAQDRREWIDDRVGDEKFDLEGQTLLIAGLGGIGSALARKATALGLHVIGIRHRPDGAPPGVSELVSGDRLSEALGRSDHVALCLPLTPATTGFLSEQELRAMKRSSYIYNVGRGRSIDREALIRALQEGWIAGAGLDVTDPEPLPPDDPLWGFPNVILSQHTSGGSRDLDRRVTDIFIENLRRYVAGHPMDNLVEFSRQY